MTSVARSTVLRYPEDWPEEIDHRRRLARGLNAESLRIDALEEAVMPELLSRLRLLRIGSLYTFDVPQFDTGMGYYIRFTSHPTDPVYIDQIVIKYKGDDLDLLTEVFAGGTIAGGTLSPVRPLNKLNPILPDPTIGFIDADAPTVAGTLVVALVGNAIQLLGVNIFPPAQEFYLSFTNLGGGIGPMDVAIGFDLARVPELAL